MTQALMRSLLREESRLHLVRLGRALGRHLDVRGVVDDDAKVAHDVRQQNRAFVEREPRADAVARAGRERAERVRVALALVEPLVNTVAYFFHEKFWERRRAAA